MFSLAWCLLWVRNPYIELQTGEAAVELKIIQLELLLLEGSDTMKFVWFRSKQYK